MSMTLLFAFASAVWIASSDPAATPRFVREFDVGKGIESAVLRVTGVGFYEAELNGARIGDRLLDPSQTDYRKRVYYATYPLEVKPGANRLAITVGHGWYDQRASGWDFEKAPWRGRPRCIAELVLKYADGRSEAVATGPDWREVPSGILYDDIREGEWQDGTAADWTRPVEVVEGPKGELVPADFPGARKFERFTPKAVERLPDGSYLIDFGVNMSGWARFAPHDTAALRGRRIDFRYDERKPPQERHIDQFAKKFGAKPFDGTGEGFQTDHRIFAGTDGEAYEPHFVYHGFRYLTVSGLPAAPSADEFAAWQVNSGMGIVGVFECSDPSFNELMRMADRSYRANFTDGVPTDCPHREKNGWTGDASLASRFGQYFYENTACYRKWIRDILDAQNAEGAIPGIVPSPGWGYDFRPWDRRSPGPAWDSALPVIAWRLFRYRGDREVLKPVPAALERILDYTWSRRTAEDLVNESLGEWCAAGAKPDGRYVLTAYFIGNAELGARIAETVGDIRRAEKFRGLAATARAALRAKFHHGSGSFEDESQTALAIALAFGLNESAEERRQTGELLLKEIAETDGHLDVGILGLDKLGEVLRSLGENRLFFRMLVNPTEPSPRASWLDRGLTTLAEDFGRKASWNHVMFASFGAWAFSDLAGIRPAEDGEDADCVIAPDPIRDLTYVKAKTDFGKGAIRSAWTRTGDAFALQVEVPAGTRAKVVLPDGRTKALAGGRGAYACRLPPEKPVRVFRITHRHDPFFWVDPGDVVMAPFGQIRATPTSVDCPTVGTLRFRPQAEGVRTEIAAADHAALYRFTRTGAGKLSLRVDPQGRKGFAHVLAFDRPSDASVRDASGREVFTFDLKSGEPLLMKVAISGVDGDGARANLEKGIVGWDFESVVRATRTGWNAFLRKAELTGADDETFRAYYTALYNAAAVPRNVADVDRRFRGDDGEVRTASRGRHYVTPGADNYREVLPLLTLLAHPAHSDDFLWSPIESGKLSEGHAIVSVADGYFKKHRGVDYVRAWPAIRKALVRRKPCGEGDAAGRLAQGYDDWCAANLAQALGFAEDERLLRARAQAWTNLPVRTENSPGQTGSQYVFACLGFHPDRHTTGEFVLGAPKAPGGRLVLFESDEAPTNLLVIKTVNWTKGGGRVRRVTLNGRELRDFRLSRWDVFKGGELVFEMEQGGEK